MAAAGRTVARAVFPHAPLIKFPNRVGVPRPDAQKVLKKGMAAGQSSSSSHSSPVTSSAPATLSRWLQGTPDTAATVGALPQRYHRRMMPLEEMEYIQHGGPE